jgi:hypothetical protein
MITRRFPLPWSIIENVDCFIVHDATNRPLGCFFFEVPQHSAVGKRLTREESRRMAVSFARLPELLRRR